MIYIESSDSTSLASVLSKCPTNKIVKDMRTGEVWEYSNDNWIVASKNSLAKITVSSNLPTGVPSDNELWIVV